VPGSCSPLLMAKQTPRSHATLRSAWTPCVRDGAAAAMHGLDGLRDLPRCGRQGTFDATVVAEVKAMARELSTDSEKHSNDPAHPFDGRFDRTDRHWNVDRIAG
jgi:hypothetical protein